MSERFVSNWWSIRIPLGWESEEDEDCVTFSSSNGCGALQISAYFKERGSVTDEDVSEFAFDEVPDERGLMKVSYGSFEGLETSYFESESFRRVCWLRNHNLLVYLTYSCSAGDQFAEKQIIDGVLASLEPVDVMPVGH